MSSAHFAAVRELLEDFPFTLYEGQVPDRPTFPYAVLFMDTGRGDESGRKMSGQARAVHDFQVKSVALSDAAVRLVVDVVHSRLIDARPSVSGCRSGRVRHVTSIPVRADLDVTDPETGLSPMFATDTFSFRSTPVTG